MRKATDSVKRYKEVTEEIYELVWEFFGTQYEGEAISDKACIWFRTANPQLADMTPLWMIENGRAEKVLAFVKSCKEDNVWGSKLQR